MAANVDSKTFDAMVDVVLRAKGTPRDDLFEYPYNAFESRDILKSAEGSVYEMLRILKAAGS